MITPCAVHEGGERVGRGEEGNLLEKVSLFPLELITLAKTFCSGPWDCAAAPQAAVPLRSPGAVEGLPGWKSVYSCIVMSGRRQQRVPARQREAFSKTPRATAAEGAGLPAEAGEDFLFSCRSVTDISPAQPTGWTNPALWSATNQENFCFYGQDPVDGAGVLWGRRGRDGQIFAQRRQESDGWFRERREKMARRGESPGCQDGKGRQWYPRTGRNAAPGRGAEGACRVGPAPEGTMPEGEGPAVCAVPKPHGASACPGPKGMSAFNDSGPYPFAESLALMKRAGREGL